MELKNKIKELEVGTNILDIVVPEQLKKRIETGRQLTASLKIDLKTQENSVRSKNTELSAKKDIIKTNNRRIIPLFKLP